MKYFAFTLGTFLIASPVWGQAMLDRAAVAAGGSVGVAGGKKISDGLTAIFGKVDGQTKAAAKDKKKGEPDEPMLKLGTPQVVGGGSRPDSKGGVLPAALLPKGTGRRASAAGPSNLASSANGEATAPAALAEPQPVPVPPVPAPPPVPEIVATRELLSAVTVGTPLQDVLAKLGAPSSRISMFDEGEAVEILRFQSKSASLGAVRIVNGAVADVTILEN